MTRRDFIERTSHITGLSYAALMAWGFMPSAPLQALHASKTEKKRTILILGAGLAGLSTAYELTKLGYTCTILEARKRAGGRVWTVRGGTEETELQGEKQTANFDKGLYLNAGAARIPNHHELTLHYCRLLKVPLEVFVNANEAAYFYAQGKGSLSNKPIRAREIHSDLRGYTSELTVKALHAEELDKPLQAEDAEKLIAFLKAEGDLNPTFRYLGSERRGYGFLPGATAQTEYSTPFLLSEMIKSELLHPVFYNVAEYTFHQQPVLLQPVGGMDSLVQAFLKEVGKQIIYQAEVKQILKQEKGVQVQYLNADGNPKILNADYCVCTLPLPVLKQIDSNLSPSVRRAADFIPYMKTGKIGLQFKRRFWEEDEGIFGGISKTNMDITQIFYPSCGFLSQKGLLVGYYNFHQQAERFADLSISEREKKALDEGSKIHPQYTREFEQAFSLAWHKIPYSEGGWADYSQSSRERFFSAFLESDGAVYFAGEHTTYLNAWMAGAFASARRVVQQIHQKTQEE